MQPNKPVKPKSIMNKCLQMRANMLKNRLYGFKGKRFEDLQIKYDDEKNRIDELLKSLKSVMNRINMACNQILKTTVNATGRKEAVIAAILENVLVEKEFLDQLFLNAQQRRAHAEYNFSKFQRMLCIILYANPSRKNETDAEDMLKGVCDHVVSIHEYVSKIHEKCFQFLYNFGKAIEKIREVVTGRIKGVDFAI